MGRETQGRGRQTVTLPPLPPRRVPRRMTSKGEGGWTLWRPQGPGDRTGGLQDGARSGTHGGSGNSGGHGGSGDSGGHGESGASGGHDGSGASGGHDGSGASGDHGGSADSDGHGRWGIWPPKKIFLGGSPAGEYPVRASGDEGELGGASGDEGKLGGASGDEGKLDETNFRGRSGSADSLGRWRGAGTGGRSCRA